MASNALVANDGKTTFMVLSNKKRESPETRYALKVGNALISEVDDQKLLGVVFSSDRKWPPPPAGSWKQVTREIKRYFIAIEYIVMIWFF